MVFLLSRPIIFDPLLYSNTEETGLMFLPSQPIFHSTLPASSRKFGAVLVVISVSFASISAAHKAAPTTTAISDRHLCLDDIVEKEIYLPVLVKEKKIEATGTNSSKVATVPKLFMSSCQYR